MSRLNPVQAAQKALGDLMYRNVSPNELRRRIMADPDKLGFLLDPGFTADADPLIGWESKIGSRKK